ncbi:helix-turn-helix domain-containing protein [Streptomyces orinoci]|uniref:Helix-turn-helix transcriptional regulator n=1 Tax=Streptomyces orinoci TaxID=67339 RepID=A0ABV3K3B9_STRON|nr:helix-turn-helix transcriptional regulator [Streptomyces orinoci]
MSRRRVDPSQAFIARYGLALQQFREHKRWTQAQLGKQVWLSHARISQFEAGESLPPKDIAELLDHVLEANGALLDLWDRLNDNPDARWAQKILATEARTVHFRHVTNTIPALLQTEAYARALLGKGIPYYGGNVDEKVAYRAERRKVLHSSDPAQFWAILEESALHWQIADHAVMREQFTHLLDMMTRPHVCLQVIPFRSVGLIPNTGITTLLTLRNGRTIVYRTDADQGTYITKPSIVADFAALYDHLRHSALTADESRDLIQQVFEENLRVYLS